MGLFGGGRGDSVNVPMSMVLVQVLVMGMMLLSKVILNRGSFVFAVLAYRNLLATAVIAPFAVAFERVQMGRESLMAALSMVLVQSFTVGMMLLSRRILIRGTFVFALLAYRNLIGAAFVAPFALCFESEMRKKLSWRAVALIFVSALFGISTAMGMYYYGLRDTTAAFSSNILNLIPVVTFVFGAVAGMERLRLRSRAGEIKILGTLVCVGGVMLVSLYKGKALHIWPAHWVKHSSLAKGQGEHHWLRGTLFLVCSCFSYAFWFIVQGKLFKVYPSKYWTTTLTCLAGSFQTAIIGIMIDRRKDAWSLKWDLQLLTILYSGVFNSAATFCLVSWVIGKNGPLYPSMFNSLSVVATTILESLLMGQDITVGSLVGMILIIGGLYGFLWAKGKEMQSQKTTGGMLAAMESQSNSNSTTPTK